MYDRQRIDYLNEVKRQHNLYKTKAGKKYLADRLAAEQKGLEERKARIAREKNAEWLRQQSEYTANITPQYEALLTG
ncbi:MAG: hypothetical protein JNL11_03530 [Bdellovibrionaceae bacterium]|nr:hypothetical protein [Pseudobdellovibrionaceae bacterium]